MWGSRSLNLHVALAQVADVVTQQLLDVIDSLRGGILGEHSWV